MKDIVISDAVKYIGADDKDLDLFESQYIVPNGVSYNSYVILDEKIAVMDTIDTRKTDEWKENLERVLDGRTPDYLVVSHLEPDHAGSIKEFADKYCDSPLTYLVGSGNLEDWATCYGMCIMEEMQWMRTRPISAANFFHGTLEVIERDIPVILIKGEDKTRPEMDRVEKFVNTISANVTVFDTKDFELQGISDEFRGMLAPIVMRSAFQRVSTHLEHNRRHPLAIRRYYRRLDY